MNYREKKQEISDVVYRPNPWVERNIKKAYLRDEYLRKFVDISQTYSQADTEGWGIELWDYVYCVADIQAQMIVGEKNISWNGVSIFGPGADIPDEARRNFISDCRRKTDTGDIDVGIPTSRIADWKKSAEWKKCTLITDPIQEKTSINSVLQKAAIDMEIDRQRQQKAA